MLSVLEIIRTPQERSLKEAWRRLTKPAVSAYMRPAGNIHYLRIMCEVRRERIDWKMIRSYSLDCADRILMPKGILPPEGLELRRFVPYEFRRRMLENMAMDILSRMEIRPELRRVAVYGQDSEVSALLPRLAATAGEIRVITRRPFAVADTVENLRAINGAAISVTDKFDACGFDVLLAPAGGAPVFSVDGETIVLSPDRPGVPAALWIKSAVPALPEILAKEYSEDYDLTEFVGAFCEAGEMRELARRTPAAGVTESGQITAAEAAAMVSRTVFR